MDKRFVIRAAVVPLVGLKQAVSVPLWLLVSLPLLTLVLLILVQYFRQYRYHGLLRAFLRQSPRRPRQPGPLLHPRSNPGGLPSQVQRRIPWHAQADLIIARLGWTLWL